MHIVFVSNFIDYQQKTLIKTILEISDLEHECPLELKAFYGHESR